MIDDKDNGTLSLNKIVTVIDGFRNHSLSKNKILQQKGQSIIR